MEGEIRSGSRYADGKLQGEEKGEPVQQPRSGSRYADVQKPKRKGLRGDVQRTKDSGTAAGGAERIGGSRYADKAQADSVKTAVRKPKTGSRYESNRSSGRVRPTEFEVEVKELKRAQREEVPAQESQTAQPEVLVQEREAVRTDVLAQERETAQNETLVQKRETAQPDVSEQERETTQPDVLAQERETAQNETLVEKRETAQTHVSEQERQAAHNEAPVKERETAQKNTAEQERQAARKDAPEQEKQAARKDASEQEKQTARKDASEQEKPTQQEDALAQEKYTAQSGAAMRIRGVMRSASAGLAILVREPLKLAAGGLAAAAVIAYVITAVYFGRHFYAGFQIYGIDCSHLTAAQAREEIAEKISGYSLSVKERSDLADTVTAEQINLRYQDDGGIEESLKKQWSFLWPIMMLVRKSGEMEISTVYDRDQFDSVMEEMNAFLPENIIAPQDAYRGDTEDAYEVVPEVMGTMLDRSKTKEVLLAALDAGSTSVSLEENNCYVDPEIYSDNEELNAEVEELNRLLTARITYDFSDRQEVVSGKVIKDWIRKDEDGAYYIDDSNAWTYVAGLAEKYDTYSGYREFYTSIGTVEELYGGDYGWLIDQEATAEQLAEAVLDGRTETIQPQYAHTAVCRDTNDIGGTYVEVCISLQEMWCYQDGELIVDTPVVTGNPNRNNATPAGSVWAIDAKLTDFTLRGQGYATPVSYWMPFNGNVGIHDLKSRYYFGGTIYLTNGSHGCVNTPYEAVQTIFNTVSVGTPVIVYA